MVENKKNDFLPFQTTGGRARSLNSGDSFSNMKRDFCRYFSRTGRMDSTSHDLSHVLTDFFIISGIFKFSSFHNVKPHRLAAGTTPNVATGGY